MATSSINSALRFKNADAKAEKPNLVLYPMKDIGFTQGEEFRRIRVHSEILPGGLPIYDLADVDVRYYGLEEVYDPRGNGSGEFLVLFCIFCLGLEVRVCFVKLESLFE